MHMFCQGFETLWGVKSSLEMPASVLSCTPPGPHRPAASGQAKRAGRHRPLYRIRELSVLQVPSVSSWTMTKVMGLQPPCLLPEGWRLQFLARAPGVVHKGETTKNPAIRTGLGPCTWLRARVEACRGPTLGWRVDVRMLRADLVAANLPSQRRLRLRPWRELHACPSPP